MKTQSVTKHVLHVLILAMLALIGLSPMMTTPALAQEITFTGGELLGRPTNKSITINIVPDADIEYYYEYGTSEGGPYTAQTSTISAPGGEPHEVVIRGLQSNTKYYYRMQYRTSGDTPGDWQVRSEHSFWTQRDPGSTFTFTITSDSHVDIMLGNAVTWTQTMTNVADNHPDIHIDLGDTFAMDSVTTVSGAESAYLTQRQYFDLVSHSASIFLAPGNHEQQEGWHLDDTGNPATSPPVIGTNAQKKYYLNPIPDDFYSGNTDTYAYLDDDQLREDYYAWQWGDALFVVIDPFWYTMTKPYTGNTGGGETSDTGSGDRWDWSLGQQQFNWLKTTLENSSAKYKFVFAHHMVGGSDDYVRGGANPAHLVEWGGYDENGTAWGWNDERAGWGSESIHQILVNNGVSAFFHGHDHQYAYEKRDGIVYQALPAAGFSGSGFNIYTTGSGYTIRALDSPGHLRVTVSSSQTTVDYIRTSSGTTPDYSYTILPANAPVVSDIPNQMITEGEIFTTINLDDYVSDLDHDDDEITWSYSGNTDLAVDITNRVATITPPDAAWTGAETITFTATDLDGLFDTDEATFTVTGDSPGVVTLDGAVSHGTADDVSSISISHTTGAGDNRLMLVGVSWNCGSNDRSISSVTFTPDEGTAVGLTEVITQLGYNTSNPRYSAIYSLLNPPSGQAGTVTVTFSGSVSNGIMAGAANFAGVDQTTPLGTPMGTNDNSTTASVGFTGLNGDELVFDHVFLGAGSSSYALTVGSGQTELWNPEYVANLRAAASIEQATSSSVTMSWTASTGNYWAIAAVPIKPAPAGTTYELTMVVEPSGSGTTDPAVGMHTYAENAVVDIIATAAAGYVFDHWSGDCSGDGACQVTMTSDMAVTAHFTETVPGAITYIGDIGSATSKTQEETLVINTTAAVAEGDDIIVAFATYGDPDYTISVTDSVGNTYEQAATATCYEHGRTYIFAAYDVTALPDGSDITITHTDVDGATVAVASVFRGLAEVDPLDQSLGNPVAGAQETISGTTPTVGPTGTTTQATELLIGAIGTEGPVGDAPGTWENGFTAGPRAGATGGDDDSNWTISLGYQIVSATGEYTAQKSGITDRYWAAGIATFRAEPGQITYDLTIAVDPDGSGTTDPAVGVHTYAEDEVITISATAADGYEFDHWTGDVAEPDSASTTVTMDADQNVTAHFTANEYTVTVTVEGNGTVNNTPGNPYAYGQTATLEPVADTGWSFASWSGTDAGELSDNGNGTWDLSMDDDKAVTATFTEDEYTVTVTVEGNGTVNNTPGNPYAYGQTATLELVADTGWSFAGWSGPDAGELSDNGDGTWSITMDRDKEVTATFTESTGTTATFQDGLDGYTGTRDTYIWDNEPDTSHGSATTIAQDINTSDERRSLLLFDLSSIPEGSTILSAELQFYVDAEGQGFNMHRMLVSWGETVTYNSIGGRLFAADDVDAESSVDANWPGDDGYTGLITLSIPAATIQDWVNGVLTNNGWLMIATHESDGQQLRSREHATVGDRPKLTVEYSSTPIEPPAAPTELSATAVSSTQIDLSWTDNADNETGFEVWSADTGGTPDTLLETVDANTTNYSNTGLDPETEYCYVVRATNSAGESGYTDVACATTEAAPTTVTIEVRVSDGDDDAEEVESDGDMDLSSTDLELIRDGSDDQIVGVRFQNVTVPPGATIHSAYIEFEVDVASDEETNLTLHGQAADDPTTFTNTNYDISTRPKTTASVSWSPDEWVFANDKHQTSDLSPIIQEIVNRDGWVSGNAMVFMVEGSGYREAESYEGEADAAPLLVIEYSEAVPTESPLAPTDLSATAVSPSQIDLSWTDNADNEADFEIERSTDGSGGPFSLLDTVPANTTAYPDTGLDAESEYCYRVRATNSVGDSAYTDVACATTPAEPTIVAFQQGVDSYSGTVDTFIRGTDEGDTNFSDETDLEWDDNTDTTTDEITLIRFTDIFSSEGGPIPDGATIVSAILTYTTTDSSSAGGDDADVYESLVDWPESTVTWNNFGGDAGVDSDEYENLIDSASANSNSTAYSIDVTASLQRWSADPSANLGWIFLPTGSDGVTIYSAEGDTPPKLTVTYLPPSTEPPSAPTGLSAIAASSTQIDLSWTDNADNETGFEVWSSDSVGTPDTLLETVGANITDYSDIGLDPETEYCYVVRSTNSVGYSAYTDVACATTQAPPSTVTIQVRVNQESDDAEENLSDDSVTVDSSDLEMIHESQIDDYDQEVGMRFQNVEVPVGATIVSAYIEFVADASSGGDGASALTIYGQAADNPDTFAETDENITGRTKTTASAAWNPGTWTSGETYQTSDLTTIVQEIVNRGGWISSNAMVFIVTGEPDEQVRAESHEGTNDGADAPLLVIEYTTTTGPIITLTGTTLSAFSTTSGLPSDAQTYTVSGSNLEADINITAPDGFELSTDGSAYFSNLSLAEFEGSVESTTIYVRLTGEEGTFSGNIEHTSANAATKNVAVSGTAGWCVTVSFQQGTEGYTGARDAHIRQNDPTYNYGATTPLMIDSDEPYSSDGYDASALLYWDISSIPAGSTIESASITVYVEDETDSATPGYNMYEMTQAWTEGTGDGSATGDGATWNTYDGTNAWPNGAGGADDRGSAILANFAATETGSYQVALNNDGKALLENWINTPASNMGFMIHAGEEDNGLDFTSKEGSTVANRPKLTITYCLAPTTPYIAVSGTLSPFSSTIGVVSDEQSYTVLGLNLTSNLVITAPADFEISTTSGSDFGSSVSISPDGDGTVAATPIYVRFLRASSGTSSGNITHTSTDATTRNVAVSGIAFSGPPEVSLPQPADDAIGVATPPTLQVMVTDPEEDTMSVSFYGRPVGEGGGSEDFTIFVYPDTQSHVDSESEAVIFNAMSNYVVAKQTEFNVAFATHVGDIVMTASNEAEWIRADAAMDILDPAGIPYSVGPGNHDDGGYTGDTTYYPDYFGTARFSGKSWYGGAYDSDNFNNYSLFSASGMDFIVINLQYNSTSDHWDWADDLLKAHPNRRGIVAQHNILNVDNSWQSTASQNLYNALKDNSNLFLMLCGHMHSGSDGSAYRAETGDYGQTIHVLLTDYQDYNSSGNTGYMRILTFKPAGDDIYAQIYSPYVDAYLTDESNYEQFTMDYDMDGSAAFELIGTVNGVASGANASITWSGLDEETEYEWYVEVSDGSTTTTGSIWSFETAEDTNMADLVGMVDLQGRPAKPDLSWSVPLTVELYEVGQVAPAYSFSPSTDSSGEFSISGITPGTYEIAVKNSHTLQVVSTITLAAGSNSHDFGTLREGDANDDNRITLLDFSLLVTAFNTAAGSPGYNAAVDFNNNGFVNLADFSLLATNFNQSGEKPSGLQ